MSSRTPCHTAGRTSDDDFAFPLPALLGAGSAGRRPLVLAIPALDEEERIAAALEAALTAIGRTGLPGAILVLANNCRDATAARAREVARHAPLPVHVVPCLLPPPLAHAGGARRAAMELAALRCASDGVLVTSDADARLDPDALVAALEAIEAGADLVCGTFSTRLHPAVSAAPSIRRIDRVEGRYRDLVHRMRFRLDLIEGRQTGGPRPHYVEAGACLALTHRLHRRLGGVPRVETSEDRALVRAAEWAGARIAYSAGFHAVASARLDGRAVAGMAATIRGRLADPDPLADQALLPLAALRHRWMTALGGAGAARPPRLAPPPRLRASDLERNLPALEDFVTGWVEPEFEAWRTMVG